MESTNTKDLAEKLRKQHIERSPEGMTPQDIKHMSDSLSVFLLLSLF